MGSQGSLAHEDLWGRPRTGWRLRDDVAIHWVPSRMGFVGNEQADQQAVKGADAAHDRVVHERTVCDMWDELGLEGWRTMTLWCRRQIQPPTRQVLHTSRAQWGGELGVNFSLNVHSNVPSLQPNKLHWGGGGTVRCAHTVRKVGYVGPVFPDGQGGRNNYRVPRHGTVQILTQPKNSDNEVQQTMLHPENARLLSESAVFVLWT